MRFYPKKPKFDYEQNPLRDTMIKENPKETLANEIIKKKKKMKKVEKSGE